MPVNGAVAWNLRAGFSEYLSAHDQAQLDRPAQKVARVQAEDSGLKGLRAYGPAYVRGSHLGMRERIRCPGIHVAHGPFAAGT